MNKIVSVQSTSDNSTVPLNRYQVAVRSMCEFTAKRGDLDIRFTPGTSASEGIVGHRMIAARRDNSYQHEVTLRGECSYLSVRGRADGYDPALNRLEEYKTYRGDLTRMPENQRSLHWAQLKIYGAMLCRQRNFDEIDLALVYFDIKSEREILLRLQFSAQALYREFEDHCKRFLAWSQQEVTHRIRRDAFLRSMPFPHATLGSTQRQLAEAVYRAACGSETLLLQAPTGIGKTIGTLFPLLKAMPKQNLDKVFFLVAKTSGRRAALDTMKLIVGNAASRTVRILEYVAKESACEYPDRTCSPESCPLAKGFYDRLPQARLAAIAAGFWDKTTVRAVALSAQVCPYYLSQELARWSDVIIADYHYYFSASASLYALTIENQWRIALLVDEAHNLVSRARAMYSATLSPQVLAAACHTAPMPIKSMLEQIERTWADVTTEANAAYAVIRMVPALLLASIERAITMILDSMAENPAGLDRDLQELLFVMLRFDRLCEVFDQNSLFDAMPIEQGSAQAACALPQLCIRNIVPAPFLSPRFAASAVTVLFSATLAPAGYYRRLLGVPPTSSWIEVDSPFRAQQLAVRVSRHISTRYADRGKSIGPIVDLMGRQFETTPGNYLAFFSSFDYLQRVLAVFRDRCRHIDVWEQSRRMGANDRESFLARFQPGGMGIGFAVLGGTFAEGIDLPGEQLIGAFITTLGMPAFNPINAQIEQRMEALFGQGFDYTFLYPGLQRVVQAAGRIIRGPNDIGTVHLMDDRYMSARVRALLPTWWNVEIAL